MNAKPDRCKFCGGIGELNATYLDHEEKECFCAFCFCTECKCSTPIFDTIEQAIAAWNRKPEEEPITPEGLAWLGFVLVEELSPYYLLSKGNRGIVVSFHDQLPIPLVYVYEKGCIIESLDFSSVTSIQGIADLKRLLFGVDSSKGDVGK